MVKKRERRRAGTEDVAAQDDDLSKADADRQVLRQRLRVILNYRSRTDVARLTGTQRSNVSRYASGTRIPTEFSVALVRHLGVNPVWWLTGEGLPFMDEASAGATDLANELLDIVQSLNVVSQMRIGSLGGKHHLRVLRELNGALARYEDLRSRLNQRGIPILRALLNDLRLAIKKRNLDVAHELAQTADQVLRFTDDSELAMELATLRGRLNHEDWQMETALEVGRRAIGYAFSHGVELEVRELEMVSEYVPPLHSVGRNKEAGRIARAALTLASEQARNSPPATWLKVQLASMDVTGGKLRKGLNALTDLRGRLEGSRGAQADGYLAQALLLSGAFDVPAAIALGGDHPEKAGLIVSFAAFMQDEAQMRAALQYHRRTSPPRLHFGAAHAELVLQTAGGFNSEIIDDIRQFIERNLPSAAHPSPAGWILGADLYRLVKRNQDAKKCFNAACRQFAKLPDWYSMGVLWQARHYRNALRIGSKAQRRKAQEWFEHHVDLGYRCFAHLAERVD